METLQVIVKAGVYALMAFTVLSALFTVTARNLFHSALGLAVVLIGIAGVYLAIRAEFLAMVQILVYVGAVMTLVIFAIMLTSRLSDKNLRQNNRQSLPALVLLVLFAMTMIRLIQSTPWIMNPAEDTTVSVSDLGYALMTTYVFPFEVIGVVLFAVLIGALVVARKDPQS